MEFIISPYLLLISDQTLHYRMKLENHSFKKEAFKGGLLDTPITPQFKTSALVDDCCL